MPVDNKVLLKPKLVQNVHVNMKETSISLSVYAN